MADPTFQSTTYQSTLAPNQVLYLSCVGTVTSATLHSVTHSVTVGQQQQSTSQFSTGSWCAVPQLYALPQGLTQGWIVVIATEQEHWHLQIQGSQMQMSNQPLGAALAAQLEALQPQPLQPAGNPPPSMTMPPMQPMQPMQPLQPMTMTMGNMTMSTADMSHTASTAHTSQTAQTSQSTGAKRFCSQCGAAVEPQARFCSSCGQQLSAS